MDHPQRIEDQTGNNSHALPAVPGPLHYFHFLAAGQGAAAACPLQEGSLVPVRSACQTLSCLDDRLENRRMTGLASHIFREYPKGTQIPHSLGARPGSPGAATRTAGTRLL